MGVSSLKEIYDQLSQREKALLYVLMCFLIVVVGWLFLVSPTLDKGVVLSEDYEQAMMDNSAKQVELVHYQTAPSELKTKKKSLESLIGKYNTYLTNEKIDKLVTSTFLNNGLRPISLVIGEDQGSAKDEVDISKSVHKAVIDASVSGSLDQISKTIDALNKIQGLQVNQVSYSQTNEGSTQTSNASFKIILYMTKE